MSKNAILCLYRSFHNRQPSRSTTPSDKLSDYYGSHVFDRKKMQEYLPKEAYKAVTGRWKKVRLSAARWQA